MLIGILEEFLRNSEFRPENLNGLGIAVCSTGKIPTAKLDSNFDYKDDGKSKKH
jgi:hypothetical protein